MQVLDNLTQKLTEGFVESYWRTDLCGISNLLKKEGKREGEKKMAISNDFNILARISPNL